MLVNDLSVCQCWGTTLVVLVSFWDLSSPNRPLCLGGTGVTSKGGCSTSTESSRDKASSGIGSVIRGSTSSDVTLTGFGTEKRANSNSILLGISSLILGLIFSSGWGAVSVLG